MSAPEEGPSIPGPIGPLKRGQIPPEIRRRRRLFFAIWGVVGVTSLFLFRAVLLPFFLAIVVAYVFTPIVVRVERWQVAGLQMPRWGAVVLVYVVLLGVLAAAVTLGAPRLVVEIQKLTREIPEALAEVRDEWLPEVERSLRRAMTEAGEGAEPAPDVVPTAMEEGNDGILILPRGPEGNDGYEVRLPTGGLVITPSGDRFHITPAAHIEERYSDLTSTVMESIRGLTKNTEQTAATIIHTAQTVVRVVVKGVFTFFIMLMLSAYLLMTREAVIDFVRSMVWPGRRTSFDRLMVRIDRGLSGVVRGQLLICLVNGALSGIGFYLLELRYWPILTLIATVFSIIPIFGAILSSIPAVVIGLQSGIGTALAVFAWIVVIHQIEANLLNPKIMGDAAQVHPVLVVFALLAGEHLFGIAGALLAVPVLSITQSLFLHYREQALGVPAPRNPRAAKKSRGRTSSPDATPS